MKVKALLIVGSLLLFGLTARLIIPLEESTTPLIFEKQKGVCWVGGRQVVTQNELAPLVKNKINWISQTPFAWQSSSSDPDIKINSNSERTWWGESDSGIIETTRIARQNKIKTLLKPHLWVRGSWPGDIKMENAQDWQTWFANYKKFILHYAELAEQNKIEILCIGTELSHSIIFESEWRNIIKEVREIYSGKLTYAANFHDEYEHIRFWDALDFIGVQAYFSLSTKNNPSVNELTVTWPKHLQSIERVHKKFQKPVLFTEIGYRSTEDAAVEPWKWPQENREAKSSEETQATCYKAFFEAAWKKEWLAGAYFWKWYPHGGHSLQSIDFTPQGKAAERVLVEYFNK